MRIPEIDMDHVAIAAIIVVVMFVGMRLLYGYWPWRTHPRRRRKPVVEEPQPGTFDFQPLDRTTEEEVEAANQKLTSL